MSLLTPALVTLGGVELGTQVDGVKVVFDTLTGWHGGPGSRSDFVDRPDEHGQFDAPVFRTSRVVTISGWAYADSRALVAPAILRLTGILAEGQPGPMTVTDPDYGTMSATVRLTDGPLVGWDSAQQAFTWQIQVTAPDPHKYGPEVTATTGLPAPGAAGLAFPLFDSTGMLEFGAPGASGQLTLTNTGNADTFLTFTVTGPVLGGLVLTDLGSGRRIVYGGDVPDAATLLIIDTALGQATLNGADRTGDLTLKQWWPVKARQSCTVAFATLGASAQAGTVTGAIRPAFW